MKERNIALSILFTIITCGIYGLYWMVVLTDEVKTQAKDTRLASGGTALLFTIVTCGIYGLYWSYQMGKLMKTAKENNNLGSEDNSILFLVLDFFGLSVINYALIQNSLNDIYYSKSHNNIVNSESN